MTNYPQRDAKGRFLKGNTTGPRFEPGNDVGAATKFKPGPDERRYVMTGREPGLFRFKKGYDSRRHVFTTSECVRGYNALVDKICLSQTCGTYVGKRRAFRQICKTESVRWNNPAIYPTEPVKLKRSKEYQKEYQEKHGKTIQEARYLLTIEPSDERLTGHYSPDDYKPQPIRIFKENRP